MGFLAPELASFATATFATVEPPERRDARARTAAPRTRGRPKTLLEVVKDRSAPPVRKYARDDPADGFSDADPNPFARFTRLAHMGCDYNVK